MTWPRQRRTCGELVDEGEGLFLRHDGGLGAKVPGSVADESHSRLDVRMAERGEGERCDGVSCRRRRSISYSTASYSTACTS